MRRNLIGHSNTFSANINIHMVKPRSSRAIIDLIKELAKVVVGPGEQVIFCCFDNEFLFLETLISCVSSAAIKWWWRNLTN
jgi:hypothetical protein